MKKYHVNSKGEAGACSATKGRCPFGGENEHFTSAEAARSFFETNQEAALAGARKASAKLKPSSPPKTKNQFDTAVASIPLVSESKVIQAPAISDNEGYLGGRRYLGATRAKHTEYVNQTTASAGLRDLVKKAKTLGELPKWLDISITKGTGAGVSSIALVAGYKPEGSRKVRAIPESWIYEPREEFRQSKMREPIKKLEAYLKTLGREYENSDINSQVDYYSSSTGGQLSWRQAWHDKD